MKKMLITLALFLTAAQAVADDGFQYPVALCVFTQWKLKNDSGRIDVTADDYSQEYAFRVQNIQSSGVRSDDGRMLKVTSGDFTGSYAIADSGYRVRIEGKISQGIQDGNTSAMHLRSYLEKLNPTTGTYTLEGQSTELVTGKPASDGTIWENVPSYSVNNAEMASFLTQGKPDQDKILAGLRDAKLSLGAIFAAGPVCGLLDASTAKKISSNRDKLRDIFDRIQSPQPQQAIAQNKAEPSRDSRDSRDSNDDRDERAEADAPRDGAWGQAIADGEPATQPTLTEEQKQKAEMANQERLADAATRQANAVLNGEAPQIELGVTEPQQQLSGGLVPTSPAAAPATVEDADSQLTQIQQQKAALEQQENALMQHRQELADASVVQNGQTADSAPATASDVVAAGGNTVDTAPAHTF